MVVEGNSTKEWTWNNLRSCKKYTIQLAPVFKEVLGQSKEVTFDTFPNEEVFEVEETDEGIEYTEEGLSNCNSVNYISYKISVTFNEESENGSRTVKEGVLKKQVSYFEIENKKHAFTIKDIRQEIITLGMLENCKSYEINITAEIEGNI